MRPGDIILQVNRKPVASAAEAVTRAAERAHRRHGVPADLAEQPGDLRPGRARAPSSLAPGRRRRRRRTHGYAAFRCVRPAQQPSPSCQPDRATFRAHSGLALKASPLRDVATLRQLELHTAMTTALEREVKLRFDSVDEARTAIAGSEATPLRCRRLQEDDLLDEAAETLRNRRCVLRVRIEAGQNLLTFKGPVQPSHMKVREEIETVVGDGETMLRCFEQLGYRVWFRYQKYREEYALGDAIIAIDETPVGVFVEVEGSSRASPMPRARSGAGPTTTCSIPIAASSWSTAARTACRPPTCCSTASDRPTAARPRRARFQRLAHARRARAVGRPRHPPAAALVAPGQAGAARRRRAAHRAHPSMARCARRARRDRQPAPPARDDRSRRRRRPQRSACGCATRGNSRCLVRGAGPRARSRSSRTTSC